MIRAVLRNSNNLAYYSDLYDVLNEEYVNTAVVTVTFYDSDGTEVSGEDWPKILDYISESNGNYVQFLEDGIDLVVGQYYTAKVVIDDGVGKHLEEVHELEIVDRQP